MQFDRSLCKTLEYSMSIELLTEHHLEFLSLTGGWTGSSESTLAKCHIIGNHISWLNYDDNEITALFISTLRLDF